MHLLVIMCVRLSVHEGRHIFFLCLLSYLSYPPSVISFARFLFSSYTIFPLFASLSSSFFLRRLSSSFIYSVFLLENIEGFCNGKNNKKKHNPTKMRRQGTQWIKGRDRSKTKIWINSEGFKEM